MSKISWTDETWNPTIGCSLVSTGCAHCYAMRMAARLEALDVDGYEGLTKKVHGKAVWTGKVRAMPARLDQPLGWRKPRRVFVDSMSDLFHEDVPSDFLDAVFVTMAGAHQHTFQVLTKRPERMLAYVVRRCTGGWRPLPNVWLGTSIESAAQLGRLDELRRTPAAVRFLSLEPLLGPLGGLDLDGIGWVIAGGESGPGFREMDPIWVRDIRRQCQAAGVPFFFKQHSGTRAGTDAMLDGEMIQEYPEEASGT